jgi:tripartite-type tricarboxylate transporter receptor subunit TctC
VLIRVLADQIGRIHDRTIVVENRPGAGNTIGTEAVARAAPDGHTLLITTPEFVINPHLRKLSYDPLTSFAPVCYLARSPQLFVVNANSPYRSFPELLDAARAKPGALTIGSAGPASSPHVAVERIKQQAGLDLTYVPYQGSGPPSTTFWDST